MALKPGGVRGAHYRRRCRWPDFGQEIWTSDRSIRSCCASPLQSGCQRSVTPRGVPCSAESARIASAQLRGVFQRWRALNVQCAPAGARWCPFTVDASRALTFAVDLNRNGAVWRTVARFCNKAMPTSPRLGHSCPIGAAGAGRRLKRSAPRLEISEWDCVLRFRRVACCRPRHHWRAVSQKNVRFFRSLSKSPAISLNRMAICSSAHRARSASRLLKMTFCASTGPRVHLPRNAESALPTQISRAVHSVETGFCGNN